MSHRQKTSVASAPARCVSPQLQFHSGEQVRQASSIQTLGHDQQGRTTKALNSCWRVEILHLPVKLAQTLISTVILKQFCYGAQSVATPSRHIRALRSAIKKATSTHHRKHSWAALSALIQRPDCMDPAAATIYCHLLSLLRGLRQGTYAWYSWEQTSSHDVGRRSQGPRRVTQIYLAKLRNQESEDCLVWSSGRQELRILTDPWHKVKHQLCEWIRVWLLHTAQDAHANLRGAAGICVRTSASLWKFGRCVQPSMLAALICDGIWTTHVRFRAGWVSDPVCPLCGAEKEDIIHVLHDCSKRNAMRSGLQRHAPWFRNQDNATRAFLLCPQSGGTFSSRRLESCLLGSVMSDKSVQKLYRGQTRPPHCCDCAASCARATWVNRDRALAADSIGGSIRHYSGSTCVVTLLELESCNRISDTVLGALFLRCMSLT